MEEGEEEEELLDEFMVGSETLAMNNCWAKRA
jgi:hypothetical protein